VPTVAVRTPPDPGPAEVVRHVGYLDPVGPGARDRRPVVLVHGSSFGVGTWADCLEPLASTGRYRPIAFDMPEHGGSSGPPCPSVADLAAVLAGLVDALALPRPFARLGHSLGGAVAQRYLRQRPGDVRALGLVSTASRFTVDGATLARWKADGLAYPPARLAAIVAPDASDEVRARVLAARAGTTLAGLHADLDAIAGWDGHADRLAIAVPVLVVVGEHDSPGMLTAAEEWAGGLPDVTVRVVPGTGHMMTIERPVDTAQAILTWLDALGPAGRAAPPTPD
jgi:pimeloyl-ACP methyl ester carboxylesterase